MGLSKLLAHGAHRLEHASWLEIVAYVAVVAYLTVYLTPINTPKVSGAPFAPRRWRFEPRALQRLRFTSHARRALQDAYDKFKDVVFVLPRVDRDITVLPFKYLDELKSLPRHIANGTEVQILNLCGKYTYIDFMLRSDMLHSAVSTKLNQDLTQYVAWAKETIDRSLQSEFPQPEDWLEIDIQAAVHRAVSAMSAKVFMGESASRDEEWLQLCIRFTHDLFLTGFLLKHFPTWLRPVVAPLLPSRWRLRGCVASGKEIVGRQLDLHKQSEEDGIEVEDTLLAWMLTKGTPEERGLERMTQLHLLLMLASIHTTTMAVANFLFDLCTFPQWFDVLREEIKQVTDDYGIIGQNPDITVRTWLSKLEKMDSFLVESQRLEPSTQLKPQRVMREAITLKDGTYIPKGCVIAWAGHQYVNDPLVNPNPEEFDPLRSYKKRYANNKAESNRYIAGSNEHTSLAFGYGTGACPGRHFAVNEIKLILARLLMDYEWKFPPGKTRPKSFDIEENLILPLGCKIMLRTRRV